MQVSRPDRLSTIIKFRQSSFWLFRYSLALLPTSKIVTKKKDSNDFFLL